MADGRFYSIDLFLNGFGWVTFKVKEKEILFESKCDE